MAQFLMSVWHQDPSQVPVYPSEDQMQQAYRDTGAFNDKLQAAGKWVFAGGLQPFPIATCVDNTSGANIVTDGPYIDSKENLGGFWIVECTDLAEALELASEASAACRGKVEVRPFHSE